MKHFSTMINEDEWNVYLTADDDNVISDEGSAADTSVMGKEMFFRKGEINIRHVRHEIYHAYFMYCYVSDTTGLTLEDMEEIGAAFYADRGPKMDAKATEIYNKLVEMRDT